MSKGYKLVEPAPADPVMRYEIYFEYVVVLLHWVIDQLYVELKDELKGVEIEVLKVVRFSSYPALGIVAENPDLDYDYLTDLVTTTSERLIRERPIDELIKFITASNVNWKEVTAKIME